MEAPESVRNLRSGGRENEREAGRPEKCGKWEPGKDEEGRSEKGGQQRGVRRVVCEIRKWEKGEIR